VIGKEEDQYVSAEYLVFLRCGTGPSGDFRPTAGHLFFKDVRVATRAVKGHEFGLNLLGDDRSALIAFSKTFYEPAPRLKERAAHKEV
jgi:hypothetical protein